ncbi:GspE/PulE family protein [Azorhizophilus paspali]
MLSIASPTEDRRLDPGELLRELVACGRIDRASAERCLAIQRSAPDSRQHPLESLAAQRLDDRLRPDRKLDLESLTQWLADYAGQPYLRIAPLKLDVAAITPLMFRAFIQRHGILAVAVAADGVTVASAQPFVGAWEADLAQALGRPIHRVVANPVDIRRFTQEFYRLARSVSSASASEQNSAGAGDFEQLLGFGAADRELGANDAHIVTIVDWLFPVRLRAARQRHPHRAAPRREAGSVRFRIDGVLHNVYQFPSQVSMAVMGRPKSLGRMNVAEKRKPQDGRVKTRSLDGGEIELRLSTLPTAFGEKLVMHIFDPEVLLKSFDALGFSADDLRRWRSMTGQPNGIVLVSHRSDRLGQDNHPLHHAETTGDAESQRLHPRRSHRDDRTGVQSDAGAAQHRSGLRQRRALMRQAPDIIMIGETAEMAIQAALTGHLVLSTLHTNDAPGAIARLLELGVPHYPIKATLLGVMAQHLVRTLAGTAGRRSVSMQPTGRLSPVPGTPRSRAARSGR